MTCSNSSLVDVAELGAQHVAHLGVGGNPALVEQTQCAKDHIAVYLLVCHYCVFVPATKAIIILLSTTKYGMSTTLVTMMVRSVAKVLTRAMHTLEVTPGNKPPKIPKNSHLNGV